MIPRLDIPAAERDGTLSQHWYDWLVMTGVSPLPPLSEPAFMGGEMLGPWHSVFSRLARRVADRTGQPVGLPMAGGALQDGKFHPVWAEFLTRADKALET